MAPKKKYPCPNCGKDLKSPQALGGHKSYCNGARGRAETFDPKALKYKTSSRDKLLEVNAKVNPVLDELIAQLETRTAAAARTDAPVVHAPLGAGVPVNQIVKKIRQRLARKGVIVASNRGTGEVIAWRESAAVGRRGGIKK